MIIFLYGDDTFRSHRFRRELQDKFTRDIDPNSISLTVIDGQTAGLSDIAEKLGAGSLFVKKRLVLIENIFKNKKEKIFTELADYLIKISEKTDGNENVIIFHDNDISKKPLKAPAKKFYSLLLKQDYSQEFKILTGNQLLSFIKKEAANWEKKISAPAANELVNRTGGDLWLVSASIKKIAFSSNDETITTENVKEMVVGSFDENIFGLTDALSTQNVGLAVKILEEQYGAGIEDEYILTMLIRQFKILLQIKAAINSGLSQAALASELKIHPYVAKKGITQIRYFSDAALKSGLDKLIRIDWQNKTGQSDIRTELTLFLSSL